MTRTPPTPEEIAAHQRAADRFFTKPRHPEALRKLGNERYSPELRAAAAEAKTARTWGNIARAAAERREVFRRAINSPLLDGTSRRLLPPSRGIRRQNADRLELNRRAAERFFRRIDGQNLSAETTGHVRWLRKRRLAAARLVYRRLMSAPIEPLTAEEARSVFTKTLEARRLARQRAFNPRSRQSVIRPVGMTLERAYELAQLAIERTEP